MKKMWAIFSALVLSLALVACGSSDDEEDNGNINENDLVAEDNTIVPEDIEWSEEYESVLPDLTGEVYRVTMLKGVSPTDLINPAWATDIENYALVILLRVIEHDTSTGDATIEITSAKAIVEKDADGNLTPLTYTFALEPSTFTTKINGKRFRIDDPISLNIVTNTVNKPFYIYGVTGFGEFNEDGTVLMEARLKGNIAEAETYDLCLTIPGIGEPNFHWFMNMAKICPDFDTDDDGVFDAYFFEGYLSAVQETQYYQDGLTTIESLVESCEANQETCVPAE